MSSTIAGCQLLGPDDEGYAEAAVSWNAAHVHRPALVALPANAAEVAAAVAYAAEQDLPIAVQSTGHGTERSYDGALLINTSRLRDIQIDPDARTARVGAGVRWGEVLEAAGPHGLGALTGTCESVGVVGYTLGGGFGWLGREYGFSCDHVRSAELVTPDGRAVTASRAENAELFDALLGTGGTLGVVTSLDLELFPVRDVFGGMVAFPIEQARELTVAYREWNENLAPEVTSALVYLRMPPLPDVPEAFAGKEIVLVAACVNATEARAVELLAPMRERPGVLADTFVAMPFSQVGSIWPAPGEPVPSVGYGDGLRSLTDAAIDDLLDLVGAGSGCPLTMVEVRYVGGPRPVGARSGFAHYAGDYVLHAVAITPELAPAQQFLQQFAAGMRPHAVGGTLLNFVGGVNDDATVLRTSLSPERYERLVGAKRSFDPANRLRYTYPL
jgi:FAD/FMN-containing dehydrogenase